MNKSLMSDMEAVVGGWRTKRTATMLTYVSQVITSPLGAGEVKGKRECKLGIGSPSTVDNCECHLRSPVCPPMRIAQLLCPHGCLAYIQSVTFQAGRQSRSWGITITQQLCVFAED